MSNTALINAAKKWLTMVEEAVFVWGVDDDKMVRANIDELRTATIAAEKHCVLRFKSKTLPGNFDTACEAEEHLLTNGWKHFHAGMWTHPDQPGIHRELRRPNNNRFTIVETRPEPDTL